MRRLVRIVASESTQFATQFLIFDWLSMFAMMDMSNKDANFNFYAFGVVTINP